MTAVPLIHIGLHKTGSSLLQERLFVPRYGFEMPGQWGRLVPDTFVNLPPFAPPSEEHLASLHRETEAISSRGLVPCISHERLSGYPASGGHDTIRIAQRLRQAFPEAKVLIMVREQASMIRSYYLQYISDGGHLGFARFTRQPQPSLRRTPGFELAYFEYHHIASLYRELFGDENVMIAPFEYLRKAGADLARSISTFAGAPADKVGDDIFEAKVNPANPMLMQSATRFLNGWLGRNQLAPGAPVAIPHLARGIQKLRPVFAPFAPLDRWLRPRLDRKVAELVSGRFEQSNASLARMTGIDLAALGYAMPGDQK